MDARSWRLQFVAFVTLLTFVGVSHGKQQHHEESQREGRLFSLFSVVTFQNSPCVVRSDSSMRGTCMTSQDCQSSGGSQDGQCAAGFGVCCMFTASCGTGTVVNKNCTYLQNSEYPSSAAASTTCSYTFNRICPNLCQIRLDFDNFVSAQPPTAGATTGDCATSGDTFTAVSPTGSNPPVLCGTLTGQHMYLETGPDGNAGTATIDFGAATAQRTYKIKVTYYTCDNLAKAPAGCRQYFSSLSGTFSSYNYQGDTMLNNLQYSTCFRQDEGYCGVEFSENGSANPDPFDLSAAATDPTMTNACNDVFVAIPSTNTPSGNSQQICGNTFSAVQGSTTPGTILSNIPGNVIVNTFSAADLDDVDPLRGYNLDFSQVPC